MKKSSSGAAMPTKSQQGTYNKGRHQALNAYPGVRKTQSGTVGGAKNSSKSRY